MSLWAHLVISEGKARFTLKAFYHTSWSMDAIPISTIFQNFELCLFNLPTQPELGAQ